MTTRPCILSMDLCFADLQRNYPDDRIHSTPPKRLRCSRGYDRGIVEPKGLTLNTADRTSLQAVVGRPTKQQQIKVSQNAIIIY